MRRTLAAALAILAASSLSQPARAGVMTYLAIGDSLAFGETTFAQNPSNGDRGYVGDVASTLASQNGGVGPNVVNLGIDGETSSSFTSAAGRVVSVPGMTDTQLASWNTNYTDPSTSQFAMMTQAIQAAKSAGNDVGLVTISLGADDLFKLAANPTFIAASPATQQAMLATTLNQVGSTYAVILAELHALAPNAKVDVVGEYNPFPANPANPLNAFAGPAIQALNSTIAAVASQWGANYINTYSAFVGNEAAYTYLSPTSDNVHPNALGYSVIAGLITGSEVPEPSTFAVMGLGFAALLAAARRRARAA